MGIHVAEVTMAELAKRLFPESEPPDDYQKIIVTIQYHATPAEIRKANEQMFMGKPMMMPSTATIRVEFDEEAEPDSA